MSIKKNETKLKAYVCVLGERRLQKGEGNLLSADGRNAEQWTDRLADEFCESGRTSELSGGEDCMEDGRAPSSLIADACTLSRKGGGEDDEDEDEDEANDAAKPADVNRASSPDERKGQGAYVTNQLQLYGKW